MTTPHFNLPSAGEGEMNMTYQWPAVFETGILDVNESDPHGRAKACADGLCGWANCMVGAEIPENFGKGMAAIGRFLDITPTADKLSEYGKQFMDAEESK